MIKSILSILTPDIQTLRMVLILVTTEANSSELKQKWYFL